jgi:hypothetical protein
MNQERGQTSRTVDASIVDSYCADERKFLHDLSNPLAIAIGMLESVIDDGKIKGTLNEVQTIKLDKVKVAIDKMTELLRARRTEIIVTQASLRAPTSTEAGAPVETKKAG